MLLLAIASYCYGGIGLNVYILPLLFGLFITSRPFEHDGYILSSPNTVVRYIIYQKPPFDRWIPRDNRTTDRYGLYIFCLPLFSETVACLLQERGGIFSNPT